MSKKDFKAINPANAFLTPVEEAPPAAPAAAPVERSTIQVPAPREVKSARFNLVIKPSTAEAIRKIAAMNQYSINGVINLVLEDYVQREAATIARYDAVFERGE